MSGFDGFGTGAIPWFEGLERDNSKAYFEATRATWQTAVRDPLALLLEELAGEFGGTAKLFRQHRDVRFSNDKSPYKTHTYGVIGDFAASPAGFYVELSADGLYAATGYYGMARDQLQRYVEAVAGDRFGPELAAIVEQIEADGLRVAGRALKTAPRGHKRDHPRIRLLRHKDLIAGLDLPPGPALTTPQAREHVARTWRAALPLDAWLDAHVGPSDIPPEERFARGR